MQFSATARRLGILSAGTVVVLTVAYAITLGLGLASLNSPNEAIGDPMFSIMEILIIALMPAMVTLMVAVHEWAPPDAKSLSLTSLLFMSILACVTTTLHFTILTLSRDAAFAQQPWARLIFSFEWPSVAYAVDIVAWDFFFALSMLFAAPIFRGTPLRTSIRLLMGLSGALALAGLSGVLLGDMRFRNIGIAGYVGIFPVVTALLARMFYGTQPAADQGDRDTSGRCPPEKRWPSKTI
jgi:hypothetical protein